MSVPWWLRGRASRGRSENDAGLPTGPLLAASRAPGARFRFVAPPENRSVAVGSKSGRQDLNLRPPGPQPGALPDCATPRGTACPERATGLEPALRAWKAFVQPLHHARQRSEAYRSGRDVGAASSASGRRRRSSVGTSPSSSSITRAATGRPSCRARRRASRPSPERSRPSGEASSAISHANSSIVPSRWSGTDERGRAPDVLRVLAQRLGVEAADRRGDDGDAALGPLARLLARDLLDRRARRARVGEARVAAVRRDRDVDDRAAALAEAGLDGGRASSSSCPRR